MRCSFCGFADTRVLDSRPVEDGYSIRRRRECTACGKRFTTYEKMDELPLVVVKKDGRREPFDRHKLLQGLLKACQKRPISVSRLEEMAGQIERELKGTANREVRSQSIGEAVVNELKDVDEVAYVRFASVYREFRDAETFVREIGRLLKNKEQAD
ncbi:MAG: transcriptional regulator NrdR [Peptococcaceae bacterium]|nr:transcriptional regulator NrdR [Peptococcaceae bacterium]